MARYRADDGTILNTELASQLWEEETDFDGRNRISRATGSQWEHETLYRSRKGRYYIERVSQWQGVTPTAHLVSKAEAARWLLLNEHDLADLAGEAEVEE